jgi:hypothetical protein
LLLFSPCLIFAALENGAAFFGWGIKSKLIRHHELHHLRKSAAIFW